MLLALAWPAPGSAQIAAEEEALPVDSEPASDEDIRPATDDGGNDVSDDQSLVLVAPRRTLAFDELIEELEVQRWPDGIGRLERHLADEQTRVMEGASPGAMSSPAATFPILAVGKELGRLLRGAGNGRRSADIGRPARSVRLLVRAADGRPPAEIEITPVAPGGAGVPFVVPCDAAGRCVVEGLTATADRIRVRARGEAEVPLDGNGFATVQLSP